MIIESSHFFTMEHPKRSTVLQCLAYTNEHRRCRLERNSERTCEIHRNYYTNWITKHPLNSFLSYNTRRKYNEIYFQLRNGYVRVTKNYINYNFGIGHIQEYMFLIHHANINPLWNVMLFEYTISQKRNNLTDFNHLLVDSDACVQALTYLIKQEAIDWERVLSVPNWKQLMGSSVFVDLAVQDQKDTLLPIFVEKQRSLMESQSLLISEFKEELLSVCWHPSRIDKWRHELLEWN